MNDLAIALQKIEHEHSAALDEAFNAWYPELKKIAHARFTAKDVYIIGDTPFDVFAGKKAGYKTIAVGTGYADWKELIAARPDHLAKDFRNIKTWLNWFELN